MRGKKCVYVLLCVVLALFCFVPEIGRAHV